MWIIASDLSCPAEFYIIVYKIDRTLLEGPNAWYNLIIGRCAVAVCNLPAGSFDIVCFPSPQKNPLHASAPVQASCCVLGLFPTFDDTIHLLIRLWMLLFSSSVPLFRYIFEILGIDVHTFR